jgi:hypothetical protein
MRKILNRERKYIGGTSLSNNHLEKHMFWAISATKHIYPDRYNSSIWIIGDGAESREEQKGYVLVTFLFYGLRK